MWALPKCRGVKEHVTEISPIGDIPITEVTIEGLGTIEHASEISPIGDIPPTEVTIEGLAKLEH